MYGWFDVHSPDFNPIETVWDRIKDWLQDIYGEKLSYDKLRNALNAAWKQITPEFLSDLVNSMQAGCETVIQANGMHTEYSLFYTCNSASLSWRASLYHAG